MKLTERDLQIFQYLRKIGWSLSSNISLQFFDNSLSSAYKRLSKLENLGLIRSTTLKEFKHLHIKKETQNILFSKCPMNQKIYSLSDKMAEELGISLSFNSDRRLVIHQLMANYALGFYTSSLRNIEYYTNEEHRILSRYNSFYSSFEEDEPDLVITNNDKRIAIEIERKARRGLSRFNSAYEDRIYKLTLNYDLVIYVMEDLNDFKRMISLSIGSSRVGFSTIYDLNSIYIKGEEPRSFHHFYKANSDL